MTDTAEDQDSGPGPATGRRAAKGKPRKRKSRASVLGELPVLLGIALVIALIVKAFVVQAFYIPSGSMEPTLQVGDRVLVDKVSYRFGDIHRGDIVVFNGVDSFSPEVDLSEPSNPVAKVLRGIGSLVGLAPPSEKDFVKRVIGVGGDRVVCCDDKGRVTVNGVPLTEPYVMPGDAPSDDPFDVVVPPGKLWVLGDHRSASADSRAHSTDAGSGFVPTDRVIGKAIVVLWPFRHWTTLGTPPTFDQPALGLVALWPLNRARGRRRRQGTVAR